MDNSKYRYWGWGTRDRSFDAAKAEKFIAVLESDIGLARDEKKQVPDVDDFSIPKSRLPESFTKAWCHRGLSSEKLDRLVCAVGKSYRDLVRVRTHGIASFPDAVLRVKSRDDLVDLMQDAEKYGISLVPFGGGTGVVGGTECLGKKDSAVVIVDLKGLNRLLAFDEMALTATFEAGVLGPDLEQMLNKKGYTLGHFPQSFEYSTLGGWVATRSAGQNSTRYGKIEDMVTSVELIAPRGRMITHNVPASATGPSLRQIIIGSEGVYGIIASATVRVSPLPETQKFVQAFFADFWQAANAVREIMQKGIRPSILRLHDAEETGLFSKLSSHGGWEARLLSAWQAWHRLGKKPSFLLMACEGPAGVVKTDMQLITHVLRQNRAAILPIPMSERWKKDRFVLPFLRDNLMDVGYFIDTLETAAPWSALEPLHLAMQKAFDPKKIGEKLVVGCHLSHAYTDGASLYFTFIGKQRPGQEIKQWEKIKKTATDVIVACGGALSHHHGIGYDHNRWMKNEAGEMGLAIYRAIRNELDPQEIMNPGKLVG